MSEAGFFEQRRASPSGFALVVAMHAAALGAVLLIKGPVIIPPAFPPMDVYNVPPERTPDPAPPPRPEVETQTPIRTIDPIVRTPDGARDQIAIVSGTGPVQPLGGTGTGFVEQVQPPPPLTPVRRDAEIDQRYAAAFQPPYPTSEQRAQREGTVRVRVTIGADGRVRAVERLSATSDAFWAVAERQALRHWRFRPATVDGRPIESTKVMTLHFRLADV
ncbi:TonB family protein [Sphingosinicella sp. LHD-64]|uniref:energy transducer TonB n=1 Tax=Sphingosinicella sp. LHD-64 TaxID=3072139 RepID=UPI00280C52F4|nr:TonB family protein [Sphingosinicella sp. LHD-64]MDQ8756965.1 TonB family protein [Sphingosinicella sp. LHD-64]